MTDVIIIQIIFGAATSFVVFFLVDRLVLKLFKVSESAAAVITFFAVEVFFFLLNQNYFVMVWSSVWFVISLILINKDKKKEKERDEDINDGIDIN